MTDSRAKSGDRFAYRAIVRRPKPDFNVSIAAKNVTVGAGSGQEIEVFLDRIDGFDDEVTLTVDPLPKGFHLTNPVTVQAGHNTASLVLFADSDAKAPAKDRLPSRLRVRRRSKAKK